ncbi:MAG: 3-hydroxyacyl-CoA dehydrogenase NAD-binding domain-containing protein [Janthinobacterium lividum]
MKHVRVDVAGDGIATITLDHATESVNLVSPEWVAEFTAAVEQVAKDDAVKGVIVTSAKKVFMAGADLKFMVSCFDNGMTMHEAFEFSQTATAMHRKLETCGKPVVAAINGAALGGGFELALACHGRVIVDNPKAVVGLPEVKVGLLAGSGGTQRLLRIAGTKIALELMLDGTAVPPEKAKALGIVDEVVPAAELLNAARAWLATHPDPVRAWDKKGYKTPEHPGLLDPNNATIFMNQSAMVSAKGSRNYPAPIAIAACVFEGMQLPMDKALRVESKYFATLLTSPIARNIIRTTFINKAAADKLINRPQGIPPFKATKVGVLGAGLMGGGVAFVSAQAGIEVVLLDSTIERARAGHDYSAKALKRDVEKGRRSQADADTILARITPTADYADLKGCQLVVEAVFEDVGVKADVTRKAEAVLGPDAIFASNTSTLPITGLSEASVRPDKFIGLHFFSPVERMPLIEVILGSRTSQETLAHSLDFVAQIRKTPITVNDSRGFYTSRVFQTFIHEGMAMLDEGVKPAIIENGARSAGMPIGPLALTDELTLDLPLKIIRQAQAEPGNSFIPPVGLPVLEKMTAAGRSGRKSGGGFLDYPEKAKKHLWSGLSEIFPVAATQPDLELVRKRFLYIQAMETARCLEERVLMHAEDGDLGAVLGWGFPTWTGGTSSLIDTVGIKTFVAECETLADRYGERFRPSDWMRARAIAGTPFLSPQNDTPIPSRPRPD